MQNWETMPQANYEHNWYGNMFSIIKREPITPAFSVEQHDVNSQKVKFPTENHCSSPTSPSSHSQVDGIEGHGFYNMSNNNNPLGFNPLTPPGYPNPMIPKINFNQDLTFSDPAVITISATSKPTDQVPHQDVPPQTELTQSLTPSYTPPMDITPPKSPKSLPATPEKDNEASSNSNDSGEEMRYADSDNDDESISKPKFNSHGKVKKFKCKQCGYVAITKVDFWAHAREHIKPEKLLECHFCPFVTELKHHLEYHIRKHKNLKPFQCDQCAYSCVNKSMLNSHLKSHSKVYQYRCADCDYATKYCHSFKLHLRKYTHKPGMVLNEDGTPNPLIIIDVYGTRRGPKMKGREKGTTSKLHRQESVANGQKTQHTAKSCDKSVSQRHSSQMLSNQPSNLVSNLLPSTLANMLQQSRNLPFFPYLNLNLQMLAAHQQAVFAQMPPNIATDQSAAMDDVPSEEITSKLESEPDDTLDAPEQSSHDAMDLTQTSPVKSCPEVSDRNCIFGSELQQGYNSPSRLGTITDTPILSNSKISRRKGRAFKFDIAHSNEEVDSLAQHPLELNMLNIQFENQTADQECVEKFSEDCGESMGAAKQSVPISNSTLPAIKAKDLFARLTPKDTYECKSCGIYFRDAVLHTIHMGYHSCDDEFKCNMCGERCGDRLTFFVHIARFPHT